MALGVGRAVALVLLGGVFAPVSPVFAQDRAGALASAVLEADATGPTARVRMVYALTVPPGIERIPLTVLAPEPTRVVVMDAMVPGRPGLSVTLPASSTAQRAGWVELPPSDAPRDVELTLVYAVEGATTERNDRLRTVVPVLAVDWRPADALPGTFEARVRLPMDVVPYESFPTVQAGLAGSGTDPGPVVLELSVLPAYVTLRSSRGSPPVLTVPRVADTLVLLLLMTLGWIGYRRLRRTL